MDFVVMFICKTPLLIDYLIFSTMYVTLTMPIPLKEFKVIVTLERYLIFMCIIVCIPNINSCRIFDRLKPWCHTSNSSHCNFLKEFFMSVTFDLSQDGKN